MGSEGQGERAKTRFKKYPKTGIDLGGKNKWDRFSKLNPFLKYTIWCISCLNECLEIWIGKSSPYLSMVSFYFFIKPKKL
jgi:hypothetical protein